MDRRPTPPSPPHRLASRSFVASLSVLFALAGCTGTPDGVRAVEDFELDRYLGTWFEIARLDHPFERGLTEVTAEYRPREDGGIEVVNSGFDPEEGERRSAVGKAFFVGDPSVGMLKVSFFGPFYGGYNVIALDTRNYCWSMVAGPNRSYLWILGRTPDLDPTIVARLESEARGLGFPVDELIRVEHVRREENPDASGDCAPGQRTPGRRNIVLD
ncbi:MAG: lipocalin family protein [bacterium]|nr:lipocalin family protein [bacterium]